jgi:hypothetical protein
MNAGVRSFVHGEGRDVNHKNNLKGNASDSMHDGKRSVAVFGRIAFRVVPLTRTLFTAMFITDVRYRR